MFKAMAKNPSIKREVAVAIVTVRHSLFKFEANTTFKKER